MKMIKTIVLVFMVAALVLGTTGTVLADRPDDKPNPPGHGGAASAKRCGWFGEVTALEMEDGEGEFELTTKQGVRVTVVVNDSTRCHEPGERDEPGNPWQNEVCNNIEEGDWVAAKGKSEDGEFVAQKVHIMPETAVTGLAQQVYFHCVGEIIHIEGDLPGGEITVECKKQGELTFITDEDDTALRPNGTEWVDVVDVDEGAKVTVVAERGDAPYPATAVVLHGARE